MDQQKIEKLLNELTDKTAEQAPAALAEGIKNRIPSTLKSYTGADGFNIVINLRVSKLAAAAAIILTIALWANLFERSDSAASGLYNDCKLFLTYHLAGGGNELAQAKARYHYLLEKGKDVSFYGQTGSPKDSNAILLQWKLSNGDYRVVFANLHEETVSAEELIKLQSSMLQKKR